MTALEFFVMGSVGDYCENDDNGYRCEIVDMCGGRYLLFDAENEVICLTDDVQEAIYILTSI